ncbi:MAG: DUF5658 family protein [Methanoregula sp.]|jgi:hypothetical protein|nr:DUF5658 family protein [Methanoregula sp.]
MIDCKETVYTIVKKYHRHILWLILGLLFGLDILTTSIGLQLGNFEINPFMIPFVTNPGLHGMVKITAYIFLFIVIEGAVLFINERKPEKTPFWIKLNFQTLYGLIICSLMCLIWLYLYVVASNIQLIA